MDVPVPVVPMCRYNHGEMLPIHFGDAAREFAIVDPKNPWSGTSFALRLFVCRSCGYTELFDADPVLTAAQESGDVELSIIPVPGTT